MQNLAASQPKPFTPRILTEFLLDKKPSGIGILVEFNSDRKSRKIVEIKCNKKEIEGTDGTLLGILQLCLPGFCQKSRQQWNSLNFSRIPLNSWLCLLKITYLVIKLNIFICDSKIFLTTSNITKASNSYNQITMNGDFSEFGKTKYFSIFV